MINFVRVHPIQFFLYTTLIGVAVVFSVSADGKKEGAENVVRHTVDNDDGLEKTMNINFSPEERIRLRKSLSDYAKSNDPEHAQIEARRIEMRKNLETRFAHCDKDNDETVDRIEATECMPQIARHFNIVDTNEDGVISLGEVEDAQAHQEAYQREIEAKMQVKALIDKRKNKQMLTQRKPPM